MIQKPRGMYDIFSNEAKQVRALEDIIHNLTKTFNYTEIRTPIMEQKELFVRTVGVDSDIVTKEMYEVIDKKGREFVLKPEGTAAVVRALIENKLYVEENLPFKTYYISPMFRYERPQVGRNRQFHQFGVESFGPDNIYADLEVIMMANNLMKQLGLISKTQFEINYLVTGENRKKYILQLKKYLQQFTLCDDCSSRIENNPLRVLDCKIDGDKFTKVPDMKDFLSKEENIRFDETIKLLKENNINFKINNKLVRGLDYYTGFIFELKYLSEALANQQTIIAGGRYNNLVEELDGPSVPACGWAMGIERIIVALNNEKIKIVTNDEIDVYVIGLNNNAMNYIQPIINDLRNNNFKVESNLMQNSLKSEFKKSEKLKAKYVLIIGDEEIQTNEFKIKVQATSEELKTNINSLVKTLKG